jgi:hypothetical protein
MQASLARLKAILARLPQPTPDAFDAMKNQMAQCCHRTVIAMALTSVTLRGVADSPQCSPFPPAGTHRVHPQPAAQQISALFFLTHEDRKCGGEEKI